MANLDSMLVHSMACMLYEDKNVSEKQNAWNAASHMPTKYLGIGQTALSDHIVDLSTPGAAATVNGKIEGRQYIPGHFDPEKFSHGQNFVVAGITDNAVYIDTNWISSGGRPTYMKIPIGSVLLATGAELSVVNIVDENLSHSSIGNEKRIESSSVIIMPKK